MPDDSTVPTPARGAFSKVQSFAKWLELIRSVTVSMFIVLSIGVVAIVVVREVFREGIIIDPIIVQPPDSKNAPTPELAAHEIARNIEIVQRAGVGEWRRLYVDQSTSPIDLQVPGAPFTLKASINQIAAVFGVRQPTLRISIVIRRDTASFIAAVSVVGRPESRSSCRADDTPAGVSQMLQCIALRAVGHIDPKVAAVYAFKAEEEQCGNIEAALTEANDTIREKQRIRSWRERCSFSDTQRLIAKMLESGDPDEMPWVSYVFGRIHLARAAALAGIDRDQQLAELDQAINRFEASKTGLPASPTALTLLIDTKIRKGVALEESTKSTVWRDDSDRLWRLKLAEWTYNEAQQELNDLSPSQNQAFRVLVRRLEGKLIYLRWMLKNQHKGGAASAWAAIGGPEERDLRTAAAYYAWVAANGPLSGDLLVEWGNVLYAIGEFDEAANKFAQAADFSPHDTTTLLNIATAYLDGVDNKPDPDRPLLQLLIALGASANYLGWSSNEEPSSDFIDRIKRALTHSGHPEDAASFGRCVETKPPADMSFGSTGEHWQAIAGLRVCVGRAIDQINRHNIDAYRDAHR